jgi:hypothetical protein
MALTATCVLIVTAGKIFVSSAPNLAQNVVPPTAIVIERSKYPEPIFSPTSQPTLIQDFASVPVSEEYVVIGIKYGCEIDSFKSIGQPLSLGYSTLTAKLSERDTFQTHLESDPETNGIETQFSLDDEPLRGIVSLSTSVGTRVAVTNPTSTFVEGPWQDLQTGFLTLTFDYNGVAETLVVYIPFGFNHYEMEWVVVSETELIKVCPY